MILDSVHFAKKKKFACFKNSESFSVFCDGERGEGRVILYET